MTSSAHAYLGKWPLLVVAGEPVTREQAAEVIIRTTPDYLSSNDKAWGITVHKVFGLRDEMTFRRGDDPKESFAQLREIWEHNAQVRKDLGILDLEYLYNSRIISAYIGGPHGWVDWDGTVGTSTYNIGKWPEVNEVLSEWQLIAETFPYLTLTCQLRLEEGAMDPVAQFEVAEGKAYLVGVGEPLPIVERNIVAEVLSLVTDIFRERGCTEETLRWAVDLTRARMREAS
jgi:hypothetical protein